MKLRPGPIVDVEIKHFHIFCGLGGGAKGFNKGQARVGNLRARFKCIGGIDHDPAGLRDFARLAGVDGTLLDLFDRDQYVAFHGHEPPSGWRPATPADVRAAAGGEVPDIGFLSAPCKGFSGLLAEVTSKTAKYQALNALTLRGIWLTLEAFKDNPIKLIVFENVPRIATRGRHLLDQIIALLRAYGYAVVESTHDCGELGGLAQSRKRFLLVARHQAQVPAFLYEPQKHRLRGVGEVLEKMPMPGIGLGGPMHRMPSLQWKTWVRLAFVEAGSDWRSLNKLAVQDGVLADYGIVPESPLRNEAFNVKTWGGHGNAVTTKNQPSSGATAVADPRVEVHPRYDSTQLGVRKWGRHFGTVTSQAAAGGGPNAVADPRLGDRTPFNNVFRIVKWEGEGSTSPAISGAGGAMAAVADPRPPARDDYKATKYRVSRMNEASGTVISASTTGNGAFAVADPRAPCMNRDGRTGYNTQGHYGVVPWLRHSKAVPGFAKNNNGNWSVADPRLTQGPGAHTSKFSVQDWPRHGKTVTGSDRVGSGAPCVADPRDFSTPGVDYSGPLPAANENLVAVIRALDGTWHRPLTTLELAALQSLFDPEEHWSPDPRIQAEIDERDRLLLTPFQLDGESDSGWRERIGNAVPPDSAQAIASVMGTAILMSMVGETFILSQEPIWVQQIAMALSVDTGVPLEHPLWSEDVA